MDKKKIGILVYTVIMVFAILIIGPMDLFAHGYYFDEIDYDKAAADLTGYIRLEDGDFEMEFSPSKRHFAGFEINLVNQPDSNTGYLILTIIDHHGKEIENITVDLSEVSATEWYRTYVDAKLKKGAVYTLRFTTADCDCIPYLLTIDSDYLGEENLSGNVMLGYAYAESTFTFQNKVLLAFFIIAVWGFACSNLMESGKKILQYAAVFLFLTAVLAWNYMYNSMDVNNGGFSDFQHDSEALVTGMIMAEQNGVGLGEDEKGYGLGFYDNVMGSLGHEDEFISDDDWEKGYSKLEAAVHVALNEYTREVAIIGNYLMFSNGDIYQITDIVDDEFGIKISLNADRVLNYGKYGDLSDVIFLDTNMDRLDKGKLHVYRSQYGLQGKIFKKLVRYMDYCEDYRSNLYLICVIALAAVFIIITIIIASKYNTVMAGCFFVTFWLSPWIVNFARNLYWVEFTWFLPMAAGLFCAWKIHVKRCRIISYVLAFVTVLCKCLCGYEYISTIMMGLISFLLIDFVVAVTSKDTQNSRLLFQTSFIMGFTALSAFMTAICIHASLRGEGNIMEGINNIIVQDVLRRTGGADFNSFSELYWPSFNASVWETYCRYFHFSTDVITGVEGNLFPILCIIPPCIFAYEYKKGKLNIRNFTMYIVFFCTSVSWFCLAKAHSYIHIGINDVLWYFGFVQTCFYVIVNKVTGIFKESIGTGKGE